jgi:hypothetical protein
VERLFFSRSPSLATHRCTSPQLIETPLSERIRSRSSARVRSGCDLTKPSMCVLTGSVTLLRIPYRACATRAFCPVAACCRRSLRTYSQLTPKRLASTRQLPSPRSSASKILTRKSSEYARPILVIAVTSPEKPRITHRIVDGYRYLDSALVS